MATDERNTEKQQAGQRNPVSQQSEPAARAARAPGEEAGKWVDVRHGSAAEAQDTSSSGLEQIREILFGTAHHEFERRLVRADAHLAAMSAEFEQETRRRNDVLELHFRKEVEAIAARVERGLAETGDALRKLAREQQDAVARLEQLIAKVDQGSVQSQRELRQHTLEQAKSHLDELQRLRKELFSALQHELGLAEREIVEELRGAEEHAGH